MEAQCMQLMVKSLRILSRKHSTLVVKSTGTTEIFLGMRQTSSIPET
jgi:hypothetical protein